MNVHQEAQRLAKDGPGKTHARLSDGPQKAGARDRILNAVLALAKTCGIAHLSIDAIAKKAAVSKGGLLYHFPTKNQLMRALVEHRVAEMARTIDGAETRTTSPNAVAQAMVDAYREGLDCQPAESTGGILAAFAEDPSLFEPIRAHHRRAAESIRKSAADRELSMITLLALEGMKTHDILELNFLTADERLRLLDALSRRLADKG